MLGDFGAEVIHVERPKSGDQGRGVRSLGPELGQDTELILADTLGYSWDQIGEVKAKGAIP